MNARIETYSQAGNLSAASTYLRSTLLAQLRQWPGYVGGMASIDESAGVLGLISLWIDDAALERSEVGAAAAREVIRGLRGGEVAVELYGRVVSEIGHPPPEAGCPVRFVPFQLDAVPSDGSDDPVASGVMPMIAQAPGFRASRSFTNDGNEHGLLVIIVSDEDAVLASEAGFLARRAGYIARGMHFGRATRRRVLEVARP